jgi:hypothetical protein
MSIFVSIIHNKNDSFGTVLIRSPLITKSIKNKGGKAFIFISIIMGVAKDW